MSLDTLESLKQEKRRLERQKQKNKKAIEECERKIEKYEKLCRNLLVGIVINNHQIHSYRNIDTYQNRSVFQIIASTLPYPKDRICELEKESNRLVNQRALAQGNLDYYTRQKSSLQRENRFIDYRLEQIEETLENSKTEEKPLVKEKKYDRYSVNKRK